MIHIKTWQTYLINIHRSLYTPTDSGATQKRRLVTYIILLMTISQMAITIYLPSLPHLVVVFHTKESLVKYALTFYLLGYGCSQFFYGPLSDIYGRRLTILLGLSIFVIASIMAVASNTIYLFLIARLLQGIGIGCGDTMGRAILCDCFKEYEFVNAAAYIGMAATITPLVAPILGGFFQEHAHWRTSFYLLLLYGVFNLWLMFFHLPETNLKLEHAVRSFRGIINSYKFVITNRVFLGFFIPGVVCFVGEMIYNMLSPFLIQTQLGWGPASYGFLSIFIVLGLLIGTIITRYFSRHYSHRTMVLVGLYILLLASLGLLIPSLFNYMSIKSIILPMIIFMIGVGIIYPNTNMGALSPFSTMAGVAGALQGGLQMIIAGLIGILLSQFKIHGQLLLALSFLILTISGLIGFNYLISGNKITHNC